MKCKKRLMQTAGIAMAVCMGASLTLPMLPHPIPVYAHESSLIHQEQAPLPFASDSAVQVYLAEDFSAYAGTGKPPAGFELTGSAAVKKSSGAFQDSQNGVCVSLKIQETEPGTPDVGLAKRFGSDDLSGQYIIDFDINPLDNNGSIFLESKDTLNKGITLATLEKGKLSVAGKSIPLEKDKWNRISLALTFEQGSLSANIFVNGSAVHKNLQIKNSSGSIGTNYIRLRAKRKAPEQLAAPKSFAVLVDNLRVYSGTELKTMEELQELNRPDSLMNVTNDLGISVESRLNQSVALVVGSEYFLVKNQRQTIEGGAENAPQKINGEIFVPFKAVGSQFGKSIEVQNNQILLDGIPQVVEAAIFTQKNDVLIPLKTAGQLLSKHIYTDYRGRGLIVIGDNPTPFDDSKDKADEAIKPQDNEKFFIEEAIKQIVYDRPNGEQVIQDLKSANHAHPRVLATMADFQRVKDLIQSGDPTMNRWYSDIQNLGEKHLKMKLPTDDLTDGRRMISSRQVGPLVINLSMLYHLSDDAAKKEQYKNRIWAEVEAVAGFSSWNEDNEFLNTAEFMEGLALAYDWMYNEWTPAQRAILEDAIINKGLIKSLEAYNKNVWWIHTYPRTNNWNAVCNGSTILSTMALGDLEKEIKLPSNEVVSMEQFAGKLNDIALNALEDFILLEFAPDGAWAEGPSYWKYTLEYLVRFMSALETATGKAYGYDQTPGLDKTAYFPNYLSGPVGSLNYGDASSGKIKSSEVLWIAKKYGDKCLTSVHLDNKQKYKFSGTEFEMLWYEPSNYQPNQTLDLDQYFSGTEVATFRGNAEDANTNFLGLKAGSNVVSHGHYDLGSFVFEALGQQWAIDLGKDDYNMPGYFSYDTQRLEYYRLNPQGHNTLLINPDIPNKHDRQQDIKAFAKIERYQSKPQGGFAITNLTDAYDEKGATKASRGIMLCENRTRAVIQDEISFAQPSQFYWFMHTEADITLSEDGKSAVLRKGGEALWVGLDCSDESARFSVLDAKPLPGMPNPPKQNQNIGIKKLAVQLENAQNITLSVHLVPVIGDLSDINPHITTVPLEQWNIPDGDLIVPTLSAVTIDNLPLESFSPDTFSYEIPLPLSTTAVPHVDISFDDSLYTVEKSDAAEVPGITKIIVSPKNNPSVKSVYFLRFKLVPQASEQESLQEIPVVAVSASAEQSDKGNVKEHAIDNDYNTFWAAEGDQWIEFDLGQPQDLSSVAIAFMKGNERSFKFDIETSTDRQQWYHAFSGASSGESLALETNYLRRHSAQYVRIIGHGNTINQWNSYAEVKLYTLPAPPQPEVPDPQPEIPDPQPEVPDPQPEVPDPQPEVPMVDPQEQYWLNVLSSIQNATQGQTLSVDSSSVSYIPGYIITAIKDKPITLNLSYNGTSAVLTKATMADVNGSFNYTLEHLFSLLKAPKEQAAHSTSAPPSQPQSNSTPQAADSSAPSDKNEEPQAKPSPASSKAPSQAESSSSQAGSQQQGPQHKTNLLFPILLILAILGAAAFFVIKAKLAHKKL